MAKDVLADERLAQLVSQGSALLAAGQLDEAVGQLEQAHSLAPKNEKALNLLGQAYFKRGVLDRAAEVYEKLVRENPVDPTLRVNLGLVHLKNNATARAVREFETAVDLAPDHKKAQNYLGLALAQAGEYGRAREHFVLAGSESMADKMARALGQGGPPSVSAAPAAANPSPPVGMSPSGGPDEPTERYGRQKDAVPPAGSNWAAGGGFDPSSAPPPRNPFVSPDPELPPEVEVRFAEDEGPSGPYAEPEAPRVATPHVDMALEVAAIPEGDSAQAAHATLDTIELSETMVIPDETPLPFPDGEADRDMGPESTMAYGFSTQHLLETTPNEEAPSYVEESEKTYDAQQQDASLMDYEGQGSLAHEVGEGGGEGGGYVEPVPESVANGTESHIWMTERPEWNVPPAEPIAEPPPSQSPEPGQTPFLINEDGVVVTVNGYVLSRCDALIAMRGSLTFTPEVRRFRGRPLEMPFGDGARQLQRVEGQGTLLLAKGSRRFEHVGLGEQPGYFREDLLYAFEENLSYENGKVPSDLAADLHIVHLSGEGSALLQLDGAMRSVEVHPEAPVTVPLRNWVGWYGNLMPRIVALPGPGEGGKPAAGMELTGEGYALLMAPHG